MTAISSPLQALGSLALAKQRKRFSLYVVYGALLFIAYSASFLLRYDLPLDHRVLVLLFSTAPVVVFLNLLSLEIVGQLGSWWQYSGVPDIRDICLAAFGTAAVLVSAATGCSSSRDTRVRCW